MLHTLQPSSPPKKQGHQVHPRRRTLPPRPRMHGRARALHADGGMHAGHCAAARAGRRGPSTGQVHAACCPRLSVGALRPTYYFSAFAARHTLEPRGACSPPPPSPSSSLPCGAAAAPPRRLGAGTPRSRCRPGAPSRARSCPRR